MTRLPIACVSNAVYSEILTDFSVLAHLAIIHSPVGSRTAGISIVAVVNI